MTLKCDCGGKIEFCKFEFEYKCYKCGAVLAKGGLIDSLLELQAKLEEAEKELAEKEKLINGLSLIADLKTPYNTGVGFNPLGIKNLVVMERGVYEELTALRSRVDGICRDDCKACLGKPMEDSDICKSCGSYNILTLLKGEVAK